MLASLTFVDWIGVLGSLVISGAYFAVSSGLVDAKRPFFNILNLCGAVMILTSLYYRPNAGAILIEVLWVVIAVIALIRFALGSRS